MKYAVALIAAAAGANAWNNTNATASVKVDVVVVDHYVTYCPEPVKFTHNGEVYDVKEPGNVTLKCPCTITRPVVTTSEVVCHACASSSANFPNNTAPTVTPTGNPAVTPSKSASQTPAVPTAGAGKAVALSGAGLAGIVGLAAFVL